MQEIFYASDQNLALNDTFGKSDSFERPRNPLYFFRIDSTSYAGVEMTTCVVLRAKNPMSESAALRTFWNDKL